MTQEPEQTPAAASGPLSGKKLLLVDDDTRNLFALTKVLKRQGVTLYVAENGYEAIEKLYQHRDTDIILMDIMMPEMDGYEAMRRIRQQSCFESLPIIALTANAMVGDREECLEAGASDYLSKPVNPKELIQKIELWLQQ